MKIGFDAKRLFNNFTGLGNHSRTTVDILTEYFPDNGYYLYTPSISQRAGGFTSYVNHDGCTVVLPHGIGRGGLWRTFGLGNCFGRDGVELYHGLSNELPVVGKRNRIPLVVTIHDVAFRTFPDMYRWHDRLIYDAKWRYACSNADAVIAISECSKQDVIRFYGVDESKVSVVYQPVDRCYYSPVERTAGDPYMLYVGSVNSRKNLLGVVKAMELMPDDLKLPLVVVGNGREYKRSVQEYAAAHGLAERLIWKTVSGSKELQRLYTDAEVFVYPSFYEGFGLPVLEAELCGCPVVTSNVSSLPEAGGPYALFADPGSPEDICNNIVRALTDSTFRKDASDAGTEYARRKFSRSVSAGSLMKIYERVIDR